MAGEAGSPELLRVPLWFEVPEPFGVLDFATEDAIYETPYMGVLYHQEGVEPEKIMLHWFNSTVRKFTQSPESNHLDYRTPEGRLQGVRMPLDILVQMEEIHYPVHELPILAMDYASMEWLASRDANGIDDEWEHLDG